MFSQSNLYYWGPESESCPSMTEAMAGTVLIPFAPPKLLPVGKLRLELLGCWWEGYFPQQPRSHSPHRDKEGKPGPRMHFLIVFSLEQAGSLFSSLPPLLVLLLLLLLHNYFIETQFIYHTIHLFRVYNFRTFLLRPKETPYPLVIIPQSSHLSEALPTFDWFLYECIYSGHFIQIELYGLLWLAFFTYNVFKVYPF